MPNLKSIWLTNTCCIPEYRLMNAGRPTGINLALEGVISSWSLQRFRVVSLIHIRERQWTQVFSNQWNVSDQPSSSFVYVFKCLQIGEVHEWKERLFKWIFNQIQLLNKKLKTVFNLMRIVQWHIVATRNTDFDLPDTTNGFRVSKKPLRQ